MPTPEMSDTTTHGVRVGATAFFLPEESDPETYEYVFGYRIVILNEGEQRIKLLSRHWDIIDGDGNLREVDGDGVVGEQPELSPGRAFKYTSFAQLDTSWGTMEGSYLMEAEDGSRFKVDIGRFWLTCESQNAAVS